MRLTMEKEKLLPNIPEVDEDEFYYDSEQEEHRGLLYKLKEIWKHVKEFGVKMKAFRHGVFSLKVGGALTLISLIVFINKPYIKEMQKHALWAILTVALVFEFTIGATLSKGSNRALGTLSAGLLALGGAIIATNCGNFKSIFVIVSIFIIGFFATVMKLQPAMKDYEYGSRVFLLTFCYLFINGTKNGNYIEIVVDRFLLISMGAAVSLLVNICICPIWAGQDLHRLIVKNFMNIADSIEGCVDKYLSQQELERISSMILTCQEHDKDPIYAGYRSVLASISKEQTLHGFAKWEPPHGRYKLLNYPWKEYIKVADSLRGCAYVAIAVHSCILSEIQASIELRQTFSEELKAVSRESASVLRKVGKSIESMTCLTDVFELMLPVRKAAANLQKKIDTRSYLLVNAEGWIIPIPKGRETPLPEFMKSPSPPVRRHKRSFTALDGGNNIENQKSALNPNHKHGSRIPEIVGPSSITEKNNNGILRNNRPPNTRGNVKRQRSVSWPSKHQHFKTMFEEGKDGSSAELDNARALSLATFASLLIEFVARLQDVVEKFGSLSQEAQFKHPVPIHPSDFV